MSLPSPYIVGVPSHIYLRNENMTALSGGNDYYLIEFGIICWFNNPVKEFQYILLHVNRLIIMYHMQVMN